MSFKLINNLIILPVEVNGTKLTFLLDSGVSSPVIFNLTSSDSLKLIHTQKIQLRGLGEGEPVEALFSKNNRFKIGNVYGNNQDLYLIYNDKLDLSAKLGITVHGIIGYDLLKDFIVTINYITRKITFSKPEKYKYKKCRKCKTIDLEFLKNKPYVNAFIDFNTPVEKSMEVKLLIDSGGTDSLWLFEDDEIVIPENAFEDFIGEGVSGSIFGMRSKVKSFSLSSFEFKSPNVAYLDSLSSLHAKKVQGRNGSLGAEILRRFKIIFDYPNSKITLKKNSNFKDKFNYNMSGIEIMYDGKKLVKELNQTTFQIESDNSIGENNITFDYSYKFQLKPVYKIAYVRKNSPGELAGVREGDYLLKVNGRHSYNFKLTDIISKFYEKENDIVKLLIERNGKEIEVEFRLKNLLK
ncbi:aspartyl protease family protein [Urechidicola croceus]|nr:aspartyl protease family protein [Urechidicola croceus]